MYELSPAQSDLLAQLGSALEQGLSTDDVVARRERDHHGQYNVVDPPLKCPAWICCLLPCIQHVPSMKAFRALQPDDVEVRRNGKWIRYDASCLVVGDILRLEEGDVVPCDCVVLQLLLSSSESNSKSNAAASSEQLLVDHRFVTGEDKPRAASYSTETLRTTPTQLFWGAQVVQGRALCVATAIGPNTLVASLIRDGRFPPKSNVLLQQGA